jgi:hypothetical protein
MVVDLGQSVRRVFKKILYYGQNSSGFAPSLLTGEYFQTKGDSPVKGSKSEKAVYLITFAGMSNTRKENEMFPYQLLETFPDLQNQVDKRFGWVNNPANAGHIWWPLGTAQSIYKMPFHEFGMNTRPVMTGVSMIRDIIAHARAQGQSDVVIYIVAHSQGAEILAHILRVLEPHERRCLRILTLAPEHPIADTREYGYVTNCVGMNFDVAYDLGRIAPDRIFNRYSTTLTRLPADLSHPRINYIEYFGRPDPTTGVARGLPPGFLLEK